MSQSPQSSVSAAVPGEATALGRLLHARRYTATAYYIGAAAIALPLPIMVGIVMFTSKPTQGPDYSVGQKLLAILISLAAGAAASLLLVVKGRRMSGQVVEVYESGMRFISGNGTASAFKYSDVQQLRRRAQAGGALIAVTFVLADGQSHTATVNRPQDARMLQDALSHFGPIEWSRDNTFRLW